MLLATIPLIGIASLAHNRYQGLAILATAIITLICCFNAFNSLLTAVAVTITLTAISLTFSKKNAHCYMLTVAAIITAIHLAPTQQQVITLGNKKITQGNSYMAE